MCKSSYYKLKKKLTLIFILVLLLCPTLIFGQGPSNDPNPCDFNGGVTGNSTVCPLDTWVWVLVIGAVVLGAISLSRKKPVQQPR
ncbi:hypothetical protein [Mucilaginibacter sp.]